MQLKPDRARIEELEAQLAEILYRLEQVEKRPEPVLKRRPGRPRKRKPANLQ